MIVQDKATPNGMFSKAGRLTIEMYTMLQEKDTILSGKQPSRNFNEYQEENKEQQEQNEMQKYLKQQQLGNQPHRTMRPLKKTSDKIPKTYQPFTKNAPREHYMRKLYNISAEQEQQAKQKQSQVDLPLPKYHYIYEKSPLYEDLEYQENNKKRVKEYREKIFQEIKAKQKPKRNKFQSASNILQNQYGNNININNNNNSIINNNSMVLNGSVSNQNFQLNNQSQIINPGQQVSTISQEDNVLTNQTIQSPIKFSKSKTKPNLQISQTGLQNNEQASQIQSVNNSILSQKNILNNNSSFFRGPNSRRLQIDSYSNNLPPTLGIEFDKPVKKVYGPINFHKQVPAQGYQLH